MIGLYVLFVPHDQIGISRAGDRANHSYHESYAKGTIRISFGRDNTKDDAADIADALIRILKK